MTMRGFRINSPRFRVYLDATQTGQRALGEGRSPPVSGEGRLGLLLAVQRAGRGSDRPPSFLPPSIDSG